MRNILRRLARNRFPYEPLITIEVSRGRILGNLAEFRRLVGADPHSKTNRLVAPVLKSNAYGHGLLEVAEILKHERAIPFFSVDSYFEAIALRAQSIKTPLLIIGFTRPETIVESKLAHTSFTVISIESLKTLATLVKHKVRIHLKIDTGMHRQGILIREIDEAVRILESNKLIILDGTLTHFSEADDPDESFTRKQILDWNHAVELISMRVPGVRYLHAAATDGSRFVDDIKCNVIRLGIGLYGLSENKNLNSAVTLKPVLSMKTIVTGVKKIYRGETVGYGNTFTAERDMTIATIPVGYYEGLDRRLSNKGTVQVGSTKTPCPIIGRVSMNITTVDVSGVPEVKVGTNVTVIANDMAEPNSIHGIAECCGTITYEVVVKIPAQLKRVVTE